MGTPLIFKQLGLIKILTVSSLCTVIDCVCVYEQGQEGRGHLLLRQQERDGRHQGQHTGLQ
jgi:hypothetical protein